MYAICHVTIGTPAELTEWDDGTLAPEDNPLGEMTALSVFPNPTTTGFAAIQIGDKALSGNALLQVYDVAGKLISEQQFFAALA